MKKIFTLLLSIGSLTTVFAQGGSYGHNGSRNDSYVYSGDRRSVHSDNHYMEQYSFARRERDEQIARLNYSFKARIDAIMFDRFMSRHEKKWQIRKLESQRDQEISMINARFEDRRNKFNDKYYDRDFNWRH